MNDEPFTLHHGMIYKLLFEKCTQHKYS